VLHASVQTPVWQVSVPPGTVGHFVSQPPQWFALVSGDTQLVPQRSGASGVHPVVHAKLLPDGAQTGFAALQATPQLPQLAASVRSTSQPSFALPLQSSWPGSQALIAHAPLEHVGVAFVVSQAVQLVALHPYEGSSLVTQEPSQSFWFEAHGPDEVAPASDGADAAGSFGSTSVGDCVVSR